MKLASQGRPINGEVGPVGDFSLRYEMGLEIADVSDLLSARAGSASQGRRAAGS